MGLSRLIKGITALGMTVVLGMPAANAQLFPTNYPTLPNYQQAQPFSQILNDFVVGNMGTIQGGAVSASNLWVFGDLGLEAATSGNWAVMAAVNSLGQNTIYTLPDPGASSANILLDSGPSSAVTIQHVAVPLSSANILAMFATPVQLIPAGAAGTNIVVHKVMLTMVTTSTAYTGGGAVTFQLGNTTHAGGTAVAATIANTVVNAGAGTSYTTVIPVSYTSTPATGLFISNASGAFLSGTGTATVDIWYSIK